MRGIGGRSHSLRRSPLVVATVVLATLLIGRAGADIPPGTSSLAGAEAKRTGESGFDQAGSAVATGDLNGDGVPDLVVGAVGDGTGGPLAGAAYVVYGPVTGEASLATADAKVFGEGGAPTPSFAGASVATGDLNGDGVDDLVVGAPGESSVATFRGAVYVFYGPVSGTASVSTADATLTGEGSENFAGISVTTGDLNGDGTGDLVVGAQQSPGAINAGAAYVIYGPVSGTASLSTADAKFTGVDDQDQAGASTATGDLNGDGIDDLVVGAHGADSAGAAAGAAYIVYGPVSGTQSLSSADATRTGEDATDEAGFSVATGDLDGDGQTDLVVGAIGEGTGGALAGAAYVVSGPVTGTASLSTADAKRTGEAASDFAGFSVAVGDFDGDGVGDLAVGARDEDSGGDLAGAVYVEYGPLAGTESLSAAAAKLIGEAAFDLAGSDVAAGDLGGSGADDLIVGAPGNDRGGNFAGTAYVVYGATTTCDDPDGDGTPHSNLDPEADEVGPVSGPVHGLDQALPSPVGGDQGVLAEVNCAIVAGTLGL